jgi:nitrogen regulatory protein PII
MKRIEVVVAPGDAGTIAQALAVEGVTGMTLSEVKGWGVTQPTGAEHAGPAGVEVKSKIKAEIVVPAHDADAIMDRLRTSIEEHGIGPAKMFCSPVDDAVHTRSGARGHQALAWRFVAGN